MNATKKNTQSKINHQIDNRHLWARARTCCTFLPHSPFSRHPLHASHTLAARIPPCINTRCFRSAPFFLLLILIAMYRCRVLSSQRAAHSYETEKDICFDENKIIFFNVCRLKRCVCANASLIESDRPSAWAILAFWIIFRYFEFRSPFSWCGRPTKWNNLNKIGSETEKEYESNTNICFIHWFTTCRTKDRLGCRIMPYYDEIYKPAPPAPRTVAPPKMVSQFHDCRRIL